MGVTMERDLLMKLPLLHLAPTPMLKLTLVRVLWVCSQALRLWILWVQALWLCLLGIKSGLQQHPTTSDLSVMDTMGTGLMVMLTGDKKWTSTTSNNIRSFPADSSLKRQFLQNNFLFTLLKNSFVLCIRVPGTVFNYLQSRNNKNLK